MIKCAVLRMAAIALCANVAAAQWNPTATMMLGQGYGQIALSQSILSGTQLMLGNVANSSAHRGTARGESGLTYVPDSNESGRVRAAIIESMSRNNPALRPQIEQAFAGDAR